VAQGRQLFKNNSILDKSTYQHGECHTYHMKTSFFFKLQILAKANELSTN
jgi:hypothetical protein